MVYVTRISHFRDQWSPDPNREDDSLLLYVMITFIARRKYMVATKENGQIYDFVE